MSRFTVGVRHLHAFAQPGSVSCTLPPSDFRYEAEALTLIGAEIVEYPATSDAEFIAMVKDADAIIARGRMITAEIIAGLTKCKVIGCSSIGTDRVDVEDLARHAVAAAVHAPLELGFRPPLGTP